MHCIKTIVSMHIEVQYSRESFLELQLSRFPCDSKLIQSIPRLFYFENRRSEPIIFAFSLCAWLKRHGFSRHSSQDSLDSPVSVDFLRIIFDSCGILAFSLYKDSWNLDDCSICWRKFYRDFTVYNLYWKREWENLINWTWGFF